ncbi:MAG: cytochrome c [Burkholderiales bacterium]
MNKRLLLAGLALALGSGYTLTAFSQAKPEQLVKQRQAAMTLQSKYFGPMAAMAQGKAPFKADVVAYNASLLNALSRMPWDGFAESTKDLKSAALPAVYSDNAKFAAAADREKQAVAALVKASQGGDEGAMKAAIGAVGKTCGGCHNDFREKK